MSIYGHRALKLLKLEEEAYILSEVKIGTVQSRGITMTIGVFGSDGGNNARNFSLDPYIKVYDHVDIRRASKLARIAIRTATYVEHKDKLKSWILNSQERKALENFMNTPITTEGPTGWEATIAEVERLSNLRPGSLKIQKPDFTKLK